MTTEPVSAPLSSERMLVGVWGIVLAVAMFSCSAVSGIMYLITPLLSRRGTTTQVLASNTFSGSAALLGGVFGVVLVWQAVNFLCSRASQPAARAFPRFTFLIIAFLVSILIGIGALAVKPIAAYVFPPWHFFAAVLLPLAFIAYAARHLGGATSLRAVVATFSWGGLGATSLAFFLETIIGIFTFLMIAIVLVLTMDTTLLDSYAIEELLASPTPDVGFLLQWLMNPAVIAGALLFFAGAVPLVEEALKTLPLGFIDPRRTSLAHATLWGLAAGAGFAAVENIFNGGADLSSWAPVMLIRVGATMMHVATGVTMGRGWFAARVERRWGRLILAYGVCVFFHAAWNALAISAGVGALLLFSGAREIEPMMPALGLFVIALALVLSVLALGGLVWIVYAVRSTRAKEIKTEGVN